MTAYQKLLDLIRETKSIWGSEWHGISHWERVRENAELIAQSNGGNLKVVGYFAYLHDSCRENEDEDPEHGPRAVEFAKANRHIIELDDEEFRVMCRACSGHTFSMPDDSKVIDSTLAACWDGDRLDLTRVGITPDPQYLFSDLGKQLARKPLF